MPNNQFRSRTFAPKHLGACRTCRLRHVRCDQKRPRCTPCTTSSRVCELSSESADNQPGSRLKVVTWEPKKKSPPRSIQTVTHKPPEARACQYFQEVVVQNLVEVFDSAFWTDTVFRTMSSSPPLRHAVVALSSLWENGFQRSPSSSTASEKDKLGAFALKHYGLALVGTQRSLATPQTLSFEEILVGGILILCFEMFQGHSLSALSQMATLFRVFCEWQDCSAKTYCFQADFGAEAKDSVESQLVAVRSRLLMQSLLFPATHLLDRKLLEPVYCLDMPEIPDTFSSISEARDYFCACTSSMIHASLSQAFCGGDVDARQISTSRPLFSVSVNILQIWYRAFQKLEETSSPSSSLKERAGLAILKTHYLTMSILMKSLTVQSELGFDDFITEFDEIVDIAEGILVLSSSVSKTTDTQLPNFDMGILAPMYVVASRCRHPRVRRRAVQVLRSGPQREGLWESAMLVKLAEVIIKTEECAGGAANSPEDIPASSRLRLQNVFVVSEERKIEAHFVQGPDTTSGSQPLEQIIYY